MFVVMINYSPDGSQVLGQFCRVFRQFRYNLKNICAKTTVQLVPKCLVFKTAYNYFLI